MFTMFEVSGMPEDIEEQNDVVNDSVAHFPTIYVKADNGRYFLIFRRDMAAKGCDSIRKIHPVRDEFEYDSLMKFYREHDHEIH